MRMMKQSSDEGSVAVIVGIVMAVLTLPLLVLVLDGGGLFGERRQLQNDADAAALAAAQYCSSLSNCDSGSAFVKAAALVNANDDSPDSFDPGRDGAIRNRGATFENTSWYLCGTAVSVACDPVFIDGKHSPADCPEAAPSLPSPQTYVQVRVISGGVGWSGFAGTSETPVFACSRAIISGPHVEVSVSPGTPEWIEPVTIPAVPPSPVYSVSPGTPQWVETSPATTSPSQGDTLAFTMPLCIYQKKMAANGGNYGPGTSVTYDITKLNTLLTSLGCPTGNINSSANGGLPGAKPSGDGITEGVVVGSVLGQETGNANGYNGLAEQLRQNPNKIWIVPVYDLSGVLQGNGTCNPGQQGGTNVCYHIVGFVGFKITDWNLTGSNLFFQGYFDRTLCTSNDHCSGTGPDYGVSNPPTYITHQAVPGTTYTSMSPGVPASSYAIVHPSTTPSTYQTTVPGNPSSAKPVL